MTPPNYDGARLLIAKSRITSFRFCGLQCVVRNETDGYIDDASGRAADQKQAKTTDPLPLLLETLQLADSVSTLKNTFDIAIRRERKEVGCTSILKVKTQSAEPGHERDCSSVLAIPDSPPGCRLLR
jgi:hypothetical protein